MKEFILYHQNKWWHFFINPFYGLCLRKKDGEAFGPFEVLLPEAREDFCALSLNEQIHVICQNQNGSILYLLFHEGKWQKNVLLESKTETPYPKYFSLLAIGGFINLFYVIRHENRQMLIHQILSVENRLPTVIDRVYPQDPMFSVYLHSGTDVTILYRNEAGQSGTRLFRWSQKAFGSFQSISPKPQYVIKALFFEPSGKILCAGYERNENSTNLIFFEKSETGSFSPVQTLCFLSAPQAEPIFFKEEKKLSLFWQERGTIMSASSDNHGANWSPPLRYMLSAGAHATCYGLSIRELFLYTYGYTKGQGVVLCGIKEPDALLHTAKEATFRPAGYEAADFAKNWGGADKEEPPAPDPLLLQLKQELYALKEQLFSLRLSLAELTEQKNNTLPLTNDEMVIDEILLKNQIPE